MRGSHPAANQGAGGELAVENFIMRQGRRNSAYQHGDGKETKRPRYTGLEKGAFNTNSKPLQKCRKGKVEAERKRPSKGIAWILVSGLLEEEGAETRRDTGV